MNKFEKITDKKFTQMDIEKMKRVKGGYTLNTLTVYGSGSSGDDGTGSDDGVTND